MIWKIGIFLIDVGLVKLCIAFIMRTRQRKRGKT